MLGSRGSAHGRGAEPSPKDADEHFGILYPQDGVDQPLRAIGVETWVRVGLPSDGFQANAAVRGNRAVQILKYSGGDVPLGGDIAGRSNHNAQDSEALAHQSIR